MSQENVATTLQFRFSQCREDSSSQDWSQVQPVSSQPPPEPIVLRYESSQTSIDSQQEFERAEFDRILESNHAPDDLPGIERNIVPSPASTQPTNGSSYSQSLNPPPSDGESQKSENENPPPQFQSEINLLDPAEVMNLDDFVPEQPVLNGPSGPDTISSQSSNEE